MTDDKFPKAISKEEINALPLIAFEGEIILIEDAAKLDEALEKIKDVNLVGFDTETRPAFRKGEKYDVSLLQISTENISYIVKLKKTGISSGLKYFLSNPSIQKIGVALHDDIKDLQQLSSFDAEGFVDLGSIAKSLQINRSGLRGLAAIFLSYRISKSQQTSNWEKEELTQAQLIYAATDSWASLMIYKKMHSLKLV